MAQEFVTVVFKSRKKTEIPKSNLPNIKRMFGDQIDYIEDGDDTPIIAQPVVEAIKDDEPLEPIGGTSADMSMKKSELTAMAENLDGYNPKMNKQQLVDLING